MKYTRVCVYLCVYAHARMYVCVCVCELDNSFLLDTQKL